MIHKNLCADLESFLKSLITNLIDLQIFFFKSFKIFQVSSIQVHTFFIARTTPHCVPKSCKELKSICPSCKSGIYEMQFEEKTKVYCDLETDGGNYLEHILFSLFILLKLNLS